MLRILSNKALDEPGEPLLTMTHPVNTGKRPNDIFGCFGDGGKGVIARTLEQRRTFAGQFRAQPEPAPATNPNTSIPRRELGPILCGGSSSRHGGRDFR